MSARAIRFERTELAAVCGSPEQFPRDILPRVALSGRSNVGKSSLLNTLLGRKALARVSSSPGKTVTVNYYLVDGALYLVDLPGYGYARRSDDARRALARIADRFLTESRAMGTLKLVLQLVDLRVGPTGDDCTMLSYLAQTGTPTLLVATKADKPNKTDRERMLAAIAEHPLLPPGTQVLPFSSLTGEGKQPLRAAILARI